MEPTIITVTETAFDGAKVWYKSRTMVGSIVAVVALAGYDLDAILQTEVADTFMNIAGLAGAVYAIYGRVLATKTLSVRPR
jgi:hypothetical protein